MLGPCLFLLLVLVGMISRLLKVQHLCNLLVLIFFWYLVFLIFMYIFTLSKFCIQLLCCVFS